MTHFKRILAVGVACTALMMTHSAKAQDELDKSSHFYPAKAWQVGSIKAVSDYSGECIIQTEFNNGFLLQINGSSNWVQQLNLNIRQSAFVVGNHYDVSLRVPGHEEAVINSVAHRDNIISVPMKGQKELFKAIRDNGVLDIAIEGHQFRFFLTRFIEAANKFERCMAGGAPGVVAAKNIRDDDTLEAIKNPDISVSSESLSEAEKAFLVNESIAFEQQEVQSKDVSVAKPAVEEEDAVAALNASAVEAMSLQNNKPPARAPKADDLEPIEPQSMSVVPEAGTAFEDEPFTPEPVIVNAVREVSPEPIVVVMDPPVEQVVDVEEVAVVAPNAAPNKAPEEAAVERTPNPTPAPTMPKSDMLAAESFLSQPERSIDMPRVKVNKTQSKGNADFTTAKIETADTKALAKITALETALEKARAENEALNDELKISLKESQQEVMTVESENWNLERATMRFNEAERQMKKLGQQLQKERAQWAMEKKELETMLFDPEVTSQEQLARLSKLEQELNAAKAELDKARADVAQ